MSMEIGGQDAHGCLDIFCCVLKLEIPIFWEVLRNAIKQGEDVKLTVQQARMNPNMAQRTSGHGHHSRHLCLLL